MPEFSGFKRQGINFLSAASSAHLAAWVSTVRHEGEVMATGLCANHHGTDTLTIAGTNWDRMQFYRVVESELGGEKKNRETRKR
ncbi:hypothetical protein POX_e06994 [Penicillium oxalicum]|uniref:Uncharacterized protein n=1 Tax=Penicillium oxalicum (strain 114-2 / CGMCC 5302) TaxID=933388 RepID=S7ZCM1_PENO1|nr:hypothetical protein POX_e06994 [Penicillium oxalicum]EPS28024.1 hypothetical protein PDE_02969 [Penicillium oxalicum 114-2]KAI2788969.1 hypothetical protein POX_e06994 [Penicillium oxalicum]